MAWFFILGGLALAGYAAYSAYSPEGWDWRKGFAALAALGAAAWAWVSGLTDKF